MEFFLEKVTQQAVNYAIRSGITITAGYALQQSGRLLKAVESTRDERQDLQDLQERLQSKIRIVSPAIDMIELISARGNTTLESAVELTGRLRHDIQSIAQRLEKAATDEDLSRKGSSKAQSKVDLEVQLRKIINDLKKLLSQIEDAVPFLNLAITASGAQISTKFPPTISPSRLLQASTFLTTADTQYALQHANSIQVGPTFTLSLYMLFAGYARPQYEEDVRSSVWKEVIHKARVKLRRVPLDNLNDLQQRKADRRSQDQLGSASNMRGSVRADEFAYQLVVVEDLDDDRVHTFEENEPKPGPYDDVAESGIREAIPIHEISKIFYADTGKILNIGSDGDIHRPVLLLKRDLNAIPPRRMVDTASMQPWDDLVEDEQVPTAKLIQSALDAQLLGDISESDLPESQSGTRGADVLWRIPPDLDPEWLAFEVYTEQPDSEDEDEADTDLSKPSPGQVMLTRQGSNDSGMLSKLNELELNSSTPPPSATHARQLKLESTHSASALPPQPSQNHIPQIKTSLSLLEVLLRLVSLQQFQQNSHLSIEDEFLNFFLSESATTGAANGDEHERRAMREEARRRVGFDPYDESPIKRRGEDYQYRGGTSQAGWDERYDGYDEVEHGDELIHGYDKPAQSIEEPRTSSPQAYRRSPSVPNSHSRQISSDMPPLRLRNSPYRSSPRGTPEKSTPPSITRSSGTPGTPSPLVSRKSALGRVAQMKSVKESSNRSPLVGSELGEKEQDPGM